MLKLIIILRGRCLVMSLVSILIVINSRNPVSPKGRLRRFTDCGVIMGRSDGVASLRANPGIRVQEQGVEASESRLHLGCLLETGLHGSDRDCHHPRGMSESPALPCYVSLMAFWVFHRGPQSSYGFKEVYGHVGCRDDRCHSQRHLKVSWISLSETHFSSGSPVLPFYFFILSQSSPSHIRFIIK